jgi:PEGA domain
VHARPFVIAPYSYYYGPFFDPFWYPYPFFPTYGWYGFPQAMPSAVRIEVTPREAKVYVDGYYAGLVDDFDGTFQRLRLPPGKHEIRLFLEGYHSITQTVYLSPDSTYKVKGEMTRLGPGEPEELPPTPPPAPPRERAPEPAMPPPPPEEAGGPPPPPEPMRRAEPPQERAGASRFGRLAVRAQPADAEILIDGERWLGPESTDRLVVNLVEGRHHVEIRKAGYESYSTDVEVRRGEMTPLNVSLPVRSQ